MSNANDAKGEPSLNDDIMYESYREGTLKAPDDWEGMDTQKLQAWLHADDLERKRRNMIKAKRKRK